MKSSIIGFTILFGLAICLQAKGQNTSFKDPDLMMVGGDTLPKVLLVGTWHFNYPGLDAHSTEENLRINIFSERRQKELEELLDYISVFKPTKIAVEGGRNSGYLIRRYERWKEGTRPGYFGLTVPVISE